MAVEPRKKRQVDPERLQMIEVNWRLRCILWLAKGVAAVLVCLGGKNALAQSPSDELHAQMQSFLAAVDTIGPTGLTDFFPRSGTFAYRRTIYSGRDTIRSEWRFPARDAERALDGPLWESLEVQWEGQRLGLFADQARRRKGCWRRIGYARFVPPGADVTSTTYVDWRLENGIWVISVIADEEFASEPLPSWVFPSENDGDRVHPEASPEPLACTSR